jgi:polyferredoxin
MNEIEELKKEIEEIKTRNKRVELDKKWETSLTRKICIAVITYIIVVLYTTIISKVSNVFLSSLVPVIGFLLSTLSVKAIRKIWEKKNV